MTEERSVPSADEMGKNSEYDNTLLQSEDYIVKLAFIQLGFVKTRNGAKKVYDFTTPELRNKLVLLPYKLKAEDGMKDVHGKDVKPLSRRLFKDAPANSIGIKPSGEPSLLRSIIAFAQGQDPQEELKIPGVVVLTPKGGIATDEETKMYKEQFIKVRKGEIDPEAFEMKKNGYTHAPDISSFEGKYLSAKIGTSKNGDKNVVISFGKVPSTFQPNEELEKEVMGKYAEKFEKMRNDMINDTKMVMGQPSNSDTKSSEASEELPDTTLPF